MLRWLPTVPPPTAGVHRVERSGSIPFSVTDWRYVNVTTGTFNGRFDDPRPMDVHPIETRYRIVYIGTDPAACFAETLSVFQPTPGIRSRLVSSTVVPGETATVAARPGWIPARWRQERMLSHTVLDPTSRFVDLWDALALDYLREAMAAALPALGFDDIDLSAISDATPPSRQLTRMCPLHLHSLTTPDGLPAFDGIRYRSRWGDQWECWAIFADRLRDAAGHVPTSEPIPAAHPGLAGCAETWGLMIESDTW